MANGELLNELRELSKKDGNITAQAHRRLTLAAVADIYEALEGEDGLKNRVESNEKKISQVTKVELVISVLLGLFGLSK